MSDLAPIALFVYNRPLHTKHVLEALKLNKLVSQSMLYIYCDGLKLEYDDEINLNIQETRSIVKEVNWCKETIIIEREINLGLSASIISGINEVISKHGSVIVLEDDTVPSPGFLTYMNQALNLYKDEEQVGCLHGWNYSINTSGFNQSTFFLKGADCWGWATWKRAWDLFNSNGTELLNTIQAKNLMYEFNRRDTHQFDQMLKDQINGKNDSWAIRWHASLLLNNKLCLHPVKPLITNIGLDGTGVHSGSTFIKQIPVDFINVNSIDIKESEWFYLAYKRMILNTVKPSTLWKKLKHSLKRLYHQYFFK